MSIRFAGLATAALLASLVLLSAHGSVPTRAAAGPDLLHDPHNCGAVGMQVPAGDFCDFGVAAPLIP